MRVLLLFFMLSIGFQVLAEDDRMIVVIDPGHGGTDPGNLHQTKGWKDEKDLNLSMAKKLGGYIDQYLGHKIKVVYTRTTDVFISLPDRVKMANSIGAKYLISVHCNASPNKSAKGTETHIHNIDSKASSKLAYQVEKQMKERAGRASRGIKLTNDRQGSLYMLKFTQMPAILVETGFMTNKEEEEYLNSDSGQNVLMSAVFRAFRDYVKVKHGIKMKSTEELVSNTEKPEKVWKIQVLASATPVSIDHPDFLTLSEGVEEIQLKNSSSNFTYKYYVGTFESKKDAKEYLKTVRSGVFKDAFIVKFE